MPPETNQRTFLPTIYRLALSGERVPPMRCAPPSPIDVAAAQRLFSPRAASPHPGASDGLEGYPLLYGRWCPDDIWRGQTPSVCRFQTSMEGDDS